MQRALAYAPETLRKPVTFRGHDISPPLQGTPPRNVHELYLCVETLRLAKEQAACEMATD